MEVASSLMFVCYGFFVSKDFVRALDYANSEDSHQATTITLTAGKEAKEEETRQQQ